MKHREKQILSGALCALLLAILLFFSLFVMANVAQNPTTQPSAVPTVSATPTASSDEVASSSAASGEIDLTQMSSTMIYSYVYNITTAPDEFLGQRFRIAGTYDESYWDQTDQTYHYIVIADATSCCAQSLEFVLTDTGTAYPQIGDEIELSGILSTYLEEGTLYLHVEADSLQIR